jgi:hypothetical protein
MACVRLAMLDSELFLLMAINLDPIFSHINNVSYTTNAARWSSAVEWMLFALERTWTQTHCQKLEYSQSR